MLLKSKHSKVRQQEPGIFLATVVEIFAKRNSKGEYVTNVLDELIIVVVFTLSNGERFIEEFFFGGVNEQKFKTLCKCINVQDDGSKDISEVIGKRLWIEIQLNEFNVYAITKMQKLTNKKPNFELHQIKNQNTERPVISEQTTLSGSIIQNGGQGLLFDPSSY